MGAPNSTEQTRKDIKISIKTCKSVHYPGDYIQILIKIKNTSEIKNCCALCINIVGSQSYISNRFLKYSKKERIMDTTYTVGTYSGGVLKKGSHTNTLMLKLDENAPSSYLYKGSTHTFEIRYKLVLHLLTSSPTEEQISFSQPLTICYYPKISTDLHYTEQGLLKQHGWFSQGTFSLTAFIPKSAFQVTETAPIQFAIDISKLPNSYNFIGVKCEFVHYLQSKRRVKSLEYKKRKVRYEAEYLKKDLIEGNIEGMFTTTVNLNFGKMNEYQRLAYNCSGVSLEANYICEITPIFENQTSMTSNIPTLMLPLHIYEEGERNSAVEEYFYNYSGSIYDAKLKVKTDIRGEEEEKEELAETPLIWASAPALVIQALPHEIEGNQ